MNATRVMWRLELAEALRSRWILFTAVSGDAALVPTVLRSLAITASLAWAFIGIGFYVSAFAKTPERATVLALVAWIGRERAPRLRPHRRAPAVPPRAGRGVRGGAHRRARLRRSRSLGARPRRFWLANALGPTATLAVGILWPALLGTLAIAALAAVGCDKDKDKDEPASAETTSAAAKVDTAAAREVFNARCSACHGTGGRGDGPRIPSRELRYHRRAWRSEPSCSSRTSAGTPGS